MSSVNTCTQMQLDAAMDAIWADLEARYNTIGDVKARLNLELWGAPAPVAEQPSEAESEKSDKPKKGRKAGPMTEEAKAKMVAKRKATLAAKAAAAPAPEPVAVAVPVVPSEAEIEEAIRQAEEANRADAIKAAAEFMAAAEPKPVAKRDPKVKMTKEERSLAAKARYAAMTPEAKAAIRERMMKGRQAAKAAV